MKSLEKDQTESGAALAGAMWVVVALVICVVAVTQLFPIFKKPSDSINFFTAISSIELFAQQNVLQTGLDGKTISAAAGGTTFENMLNYYYEQIPEDLRKYVCLKAFHLQRNIADKTIQSSPLARKNCDMYPDANGDESISNAITNYNNNLSDNDKTEELIAILAAPNSNTKVPNAEVAIIQGGSSVSPPIIVGSPPPSQYE